MRKFVLGIVVTLGVLIVGGLAFLLLGFMPTNSNTAPPGIETHVASMALDASMERHAARTGSPVPATDENLIDGMKIYTMNCSVCHGTLDYKPSPLEHSFYPPPPQLVLEPIDDPDWHVYYAVTTGVRYTGMPAWDKALTEQDRWKVTEFLTHMEKLSPAVQEYWKNSYGVSPQPAGAREHEGHGH